MENYIGKKLDGRYEILELCGIGGMANVYKAYDLLENRMLAKGVALESKRTAGGASAASPAFQRLLDVSRELEALISRSRGRPNKDLGKLADQLRQVMAKWE